MADLNTEASVEPVKTVRDGVSTDAESTENGGEVNYGA